MRAILLLAAGQSSRMRGKDKLLEEVNARPLLAHLTQEALASGCLTYVTLPPKSARGAILPEGAIQVIVDNAREGMGASIAAGVAALDHDVTHVMILPSDMPELTRDDFLKLIDASEARPMAIIRGQSSGTAGHPVLFPDDCFDALRSLTGDTGAKSVLKAHAGRIHTVDLEGSRALTDLDTPEDWKKWRERL